MKPLTLVITQRDTPHKIELAKAVTFSDTQLQAKVADVEVKDAQQDERLDAVEAKDAKQDERIDTLFSGCVKDVRFYQGNKPASVNPLQAGKQAILETEITVGIGGGATGYLQSEAFGAIDNNSYNYAGVDYLVRGVYYRDGKFVFQYQRKDLSWKTKPQESNDLCISVGDNIIVIGSLSGRSLNGPAQKSAEMPNPLPAPGKKIKIAIGLLLWTRDIPAYVKGKNLYMAYRRDEGYQVIRILHPDPNS